MAPSTISFIVPLADAAKNRKSGEKASTLAALIAAGYSCPRGFVLTADAYSYHLWESGCHDPAGAAAGSITRDRTASAMRTTEFASDVSAGLETAYGKLALQSGEEQPEVVVRLSLVGGAGLHGGCMMGVRGVDAVKSAIRELWAGMWDRPQSGPPPEAAVIVQQTAQASLFGRASTADESSGNPFIVRVTCGSEPMGKRPYGIEVNLGSSAVSPISPDSEGLTDDLCKVADKAILIENLLGGRVRIDWAIGPDGLWILDARRLKSLPAFFPGLENNEDSFHAVTDRPAGILAQTLAFHPPSVEPPRGFDRRRASPTVMVYGYVLCRSRQSAVEESGKRKRDNDASQAAKLVEDWTKRVAVEIRASADPMIHSDLKAASAADLVSLLDRAAGACATARYWSDTIWPGAPEGFAPGSASDSDIKALYGGIAYPTIERDAALHQLGELFAAGETAGKLDQPNWWRSYSGEVADFARRYGYAFVRADDRYDLASWRSWVEDAEPLYRMIKALSHRNERPSLVVRHSATVHEAEEAAARVSGLFTGKHRAEIEKQIWVRREWPARACECDMLLALALTGFRLGALEVGRRLAEAGAVSEASEVFELPMNKLAEAAAGDLASTARAIADAKHVRWMNERLSPPRWEPDQPDLSPALPCEAMEQSGKSLSGLGNGCGKVVGRVRVARDMAQAGELQPGDVLVVDSAESGWWPLLATAGALVSERSLPGDLSLVVSGEYGVPCVTGCRGVLSLIPNGRSAEVDSDTGTVKWGLR